MNEQELAIPQDDEIDLLELWSVIWRSKWIIGIVTIVFMISSVLYALSMPDEYQSTALLAPASTSSTSSLSKLAGQFGGLASLAGVNLAGSSAGDKTVIAMTLIGTWGFLESFIANNHLEVEVFAAKGWNKKTKKLLIDNDLYDEKISSWVRVVDLARGETSVPSSWELYEKIKDRIKIKQDQETGLISLTVEHYSPVVAKKWVDLLVVAINQHIQLEDKKEALNSINYLKEQANKTRIAEMQTIFYQLIEEQVKALMLAEISSEYVLRTLSAAKVAEERFKPKRTLTVVIGIVCGGGLSVFIVLCRYFFSRKNKFLRDGE